MARTVRPIKPEEVSREKEKNPPNAVIEVFNELIAKNIDTGVSVVMQDEVVDLLMKKGLNRNEIFDNGWLDVEDSYRKAGWKVEYDKPGFNETYPASFTFCRRRKKNKI